MMKVGDRTSWWRCSRRILRAETSTVPAAEPGLTGAEPDIGGGVSEGASRSTGLAADGAITPSPSSPLGISQPPAAAPGG